MGPTSAASGDAVTLQGEHDRSLSAALQAACSLLQLTHRRMNVQCIGGVLRLLASQAAAARLQVPLRCANTPNKE